MKNQCTWFWDTWYIQYSYQPHKEHSVHTCGYARVKAINKRHARKVLLMFLPQSEKRGLMNVHIDLFKFTPEYGIMNLDYDNYERKLNEFWSEQNYID